MVILIKSQIVVQPFVGITFVNSPCILIETLIPQNKQQFILSQTFHANIL